MQQILMRVLAIHPARHRISVKGQNERGNGMVDFSVGNLGDIELVPDSRQWHLTCSYLSAESSPRKMAQLTWEALNSPTEAGRGSGGVTSSSVRGMAGRRGAIAAPSASQAATT